MNRPAILNVHGSATRDVAPDFAQIALAIESARKEREPALAAVEAGVRDVRAALADQHGLRSLVLSGARVERTYRWDQKKGAQVPTGWRAEINGRVEVEVVGVSEVIDGVVAAGAAVGGIRWLLNESNPAHRQVRRDAVADAFRAAADFADAVDRLLGPLRTLADAGLLGEGSADPRARAMMAGAAPAEGFALDVDPEPQRVAARVEASFELG